MKVDEIAINEFAKEEYSGLVHGGIDGKNFLIYGGNRTGKTLSFNALIYNLLGSNHTIDLATGSGNNVRLTFDNGISFKRGHPEAEFEGWSEESKGEEAQNRLSEGLGNDLTDEIDHTHLIKSHFLHSHINRLPLSQLSGDERLALIRAVVNSETQNEMEHHQNRIEELQESIKTKGSDLRRLKEDKKEVSNQNSSAKSQLEKYRSLHNSYESGDLETISQRLQSSQELKEEISDLYKRKEQLRQEKRSSKKLKGKWERYREEEKNSAIAKAVNDFVCPACGDRVSEDLAETRLSQSRCPFCAVEERGDVLEADVENKLNRSEEELEDISARLEEVNEELEEVDEKISQLKGDRPDLSNINKFIERVLRQNNYQLDGVVEEATEQIDSLTSKADESDEILEQLAEEIEEKEKEVESASESIRKSKDEIKRIKQESLNREIRKFGSVWTEHFQRAAGEIGLEILITIEGGIEVPGNEGNEGNRPYDRAGELSDAETVLLNISFVSALNEFARENGITEWKTIVIDEPFSHLDADSQDGFLDYMSSSEIQFICTSSNDGLLEHFPKFGELVRRPIQASLERYGI